MSYPEFRFGERVRASREFGEPDVVEGRLFGIRVDFAPGSSEIIQVWYDIEDDFGDTWTRLDRFHVIERVE